MCKALTHTRQYCYKLIYLTKWLDIISHSVSIKTRLKFISSLLYKQDILFFLPWRGNGYGLKELSCKHSSETKTTSHCVCKSKLQKWLNALLCWLMILYQSRDLDLDPNVSTCYLIISQLLAHAKRTIMKIEYWKLSMLEGTESLALLRGLIEVWYEVLVGSTAGSHRYLNSIYYCSLFVYYTNIYICDNISL